MRHIYIVGDVGSPNGGPLTFHDAETHEVIVLQEAQITLVSGKAPTIDFIPINPGSTERRAQLVPAPTTIPLIPKVEDEDKDEEACGHTGWVSHDIQGDNRFWCRECDERFTNHPLTYGRVVVKSTQEFKPCPTCGTLIERICMRCHVASYKAPIPT